jgi:hypothetical protein
MHWTLYYYFSHVVNTLIYDFVNLKIIGIHACMMMIYVINDLNKDRLIFHLCNQFV